MQLPAHVSGLAITLALTLLPGCQQTKVSTSYPAGVNFSSLKTYQWLPPELQGTANRDIGGVPVAQVIQEQVDRTLAAKGFARPVGAAADFNIQAKSILEYRQVQQRSEDMLADPGISSPGSGQAQVPSPGPYGGTGGGPYEQSIGTLVLTMTDTKSGQQIWQGSAEGTLRQDASADARRKRIVTAIEKLLANFPPVK